MKCPGCRIENNDNWPLTINGEIKAGGCQTCWEKECDDSWWTAVIQLDEILHLEEIENKQRNKLTTD